MYDIIQLIVICHCLVLFRLPEAAGAATSASSMSSATASLSSGLAVGHKVFSGHKNLSVAQVSTDLL